MGGKNSLLTPLLFVILISFVNCFFIDVGKYLGIQCLEIPDRWSDPRVIINSECSFSQRYPSLDVNGQAAHGPPANWIPHSDFQPQLLSVHRLLWDASQSLPNTCLLNHYPPQQGLVLD